MKLFMLIVGVTFGAIGLLLEINENIDAFTCVLIYILIYTSGALAGYSSHLDNYDND